MYPLLPRDKLYKKLLVILLDNYQKNTEAMRLWPEAGESIMVRQSDSKVRAALLSLRLPVLC